MNCSSGQTLKSKVPTTFHSEVEESKRQELDVRGFNHDDLNELHKTDPFLYFSIPGARRASLTGRDVDPNSLLDGDLVGNSNSASSASQARSRRQVPRRNSDTNGGSKIIRRTSISFEVHPGVLLQDMFDDMEGHDLDSEPDEDTFDILGEVLVDFSELRKKA